jgi:hypothetical protein
MSQLTIAISAAEELVPTPFNRVSVGDTVVLRHDNEDWLLHRRFEVLATEPDGVCIRGAWYRGVDGWSVDVLVVPDTVENDEPNDNMRWFSALRGNPYGTRQKVRRSVLEAAQMVTLKELEMNLPSDDAFSMLGMIDTQVTWNAFAKSYRYIGLDRLMTILVAPYAHYKQSLNTKDNRKLDTYDAATQRADAAQPLIGYVSFMNDFETPSEVDAALYWFGHVALYGSESYSEPVEVIAEVMSAIGAELYFEIIIKGFDVVRGIATKCKDEDIDPSLIRTMLDLD